jgi:hypothetical protein
LGQPVTRKKVWRHSRITPKTPFRALEVSIDKTYCLRYHEVTDSTLRSRERRTRMTEGGPKTNGNEGVWMAIIIVAGIVALACIGAFTALSLSFIANAPW